MPAAHDRRRPYLRSDDRRRQLLDAAAAIAGRRGLAALTMAGVAAEGGVSRQWVYEHFSDLHGLYDALLMDRFSTLDDRIETAHATMRGGDLAGFVMGCVMDLPDGDRRILRALIGGRGWMSPELLAIHEDLRARVLSRWVPVAARLGYPATQARAVVWALINAAFGLMDQVERGELSTRQALALLRVLIDGFARRSEVPRGSESKDQELARAR